MNADLLFEKLLDAYTVYYDVKREGVTQPFDAEAVFSSKDEQYFLMKSAKLAEIQSNEYVFFAKRGHLSCGELSMLSQSAWEEGLSRVEPNPNHKSSDVVLLVVAETLDEGIGALAKSFKNSKSYKVGLWGFSHYKLAVIEASSGTACYNRQGRDLRTLVTDLCHK